jgi:hypothetical protein
MQLQQLQKTWHYKLKKNEIIMGIIISFILDGAKINLPSGKKSLALSAYPVESDGNMLGTFYRIY